MGAFDADFSKAAWSSPKSLRTISVATVTFIVHRRGSHWLAESQNAAISPCGSTTGFEAQA